MVDAEVAERLAREHLASQVSGIAPSEGGDLMELKAVADDIATALERGECPDPDAITEARALLRALDDDLDDVCAPYDIPRWETNVRWDELDEEEREAYQQRANG